MSKTYTSWNVKAGKARRIDTSRDPDSRAERAQKFKATYASLGLSIDDVAKLLHVTPRTLHNWNSGQHDIPYAAFKLLRVLLRYELPHDDWAGWHFHRGKLYTPEGYSIAAHESSWWGLLLRRAAMFDTVYAQLNPQRGDGVTEQRPAGGAELAMHQRPGAAQVTPPGEAGRAAQQPGPRFIYRTYLVRGSSFGNESVTNLGSMSYAGWSQPSTSPVLRWITPERGKARLNPGPVSRASATHPDNAHPLGTAAARFGTPGRPIAGAPSL